MSGPSPTERWVCVSRSDGKRPVCAFLQTVRISGQTTERITSERRSADSGGWYTDSGSCSAGTAWARRPRTAGCRTAGRGRWRPWRRSCPAGPSGPASPPVRDSPSRDRRRRNSTSRRTIAGTAAIIARMNKTRSAQPRLTSMKANAMTTARMAAAAGQSRIALARWTEIWAAIEAFFSSLISRRCTCEVSEAARAREIQFGSRVVAGRLLGEPALIESLGVLGLELEDVRELLRRVGVASQPGKGETPGVKGLRLRGLQADRGVEIGHRLGEAPRSGERQPARVQVGRALRVDRQCGFMVGDRGVEAAQTEVHDPALAKGLVVAWVQSQGRREVLRGIGVAAELGLRHTAPEEGFRRVRVELDRAVEALDGEFRLLGTGLGDSLIAIRLAVARVQPDGPAEILERERIFAGLRVEDAAQGDRAGVSRFELDRQRQILDCRVGIAP